jgi:antitoxin ParD1/3/4
MNVSVGTRWEKWIEAMLVDGRYGSASEVVREGLRLVEEREQKLAALRETVQASIARGGSRTDEEVAEAIERRLDSIEVRKQAA